MNMTAFLLATFVLGAVLWQANPSGYSNPGLLAEPDELDSGDFVILDARPLDQFTAGHIPGARWVDASGWAKGFDQGQDVEGWRKRIGALGLEPSSKIVVYDDNLTKDAARVWWILRFWDFGDVRLLNGGWKAWQAASKEIETAPAAQTIATQSELRPIVDRLATKEKLLAALDNHELQIVDARSEAEFCGDEALKNKRAGAIPGAKHLEWDDLLEPKTGRFLAAEEMSRQFANAGIDLNRPTATHCQSGGRASVMAFAMELMGAKDVSNYYRSWHEWSNSADTPVVKGEKKK